MRWMLLLAVVIAVCAVIGQNIARDRCLENHGYWSEGTDGFQCVTLPEAMRK